ncbi:hypothetical protein [Erwinia aphidicola]|uniref:hypothetical protein n=1 Tax=Erwinia aphidicola TaxID=68334 RepID=UPI00117754FE
MLTSLAKYIAPKTKKIDINNTGIAMHQLAIYCKASAITSRELSNNASNQTPLPASICILKIGRIPYTGFKKALKRGTPDCTSKNARAKGEAIISNAIVEFSFRAFLCCKHQERAPHAARKTRENIDVFSK